MIVGASFEEYVLMKRFWKIWEWGPMEELVGTFGGGALVLVMTRAQ